MVNTRNIFVKNFRMCANNFAVESEKLICGI